MSDQAIARVPGGITITDRVLPHLVPALEHAILSRSETEPSLGVSGHGMPPAPTGVMFRAGSGIHQSTNHGGWKSTEFFFTWFDPGVAELADYLIDALGVKRDHKRLVGWAMVNRAGSHHKRHTHGGSKVGIYYVAPGDPAVPTIFEVPGFGEIDVPPIPGRLVIFPPRMFHRVPVYDGTMPRITIAFEVRP